MTILAEISNLKAANVNFKDVVNISKRVEAYEIQDFFMLMEVYGSLFPVTAFDFNVYTLQL